MRPTDTAAEPSVLPDAAQWRRLDPRVLLVVPVRQLGTLLPVVVLLLVGGRGEGGWQLASAVLPVLVVVGAALVRWGTVRYRVGVERVELRTGLVRRAERSLRRDRVRTVDLRASLAHRWCGLTSVEIGTGTGGAKNGRLSLDGVTRQEGERLRRELLDRSPGAATRVDAAQVDAAQVDATAAPATRGREVARLHPSWLRYAPLTASGLVAVGAVVGTAFKIANDAGVDLVSLATVHRAGQRLLAAPPWLAVALGALVVLAVSTVGSLAIYLEAWWRYRLTREDDGTLRLRRGLLTTRSLSIEQRRMRGVELVQPLLLRLAGAGRVAAVTTGLDAKTSSRGALLPPAPLAEAQRVATAALALVRPGDATAATLVRHPVAALRRRLTRALLPAVALACLAWWLSSAVDWLAPVWPLALLAPPAAVLLAADRYRNLGHALCTEHLVIGHGSLVHRRVAVQRAGIIGWRVRQSPAQRWAGVLTLDAVTAAGAGRYSVVDITPERAAALVREINPQLLPVPWATD